MEPLSIVFSKTRKPIKGVGGCHPPPQVMKGLKQEVCEKSCLPILHLGNPEFHPHYANQGHSRIEIGTEIKEMGNRCRNLEIQVLKPRDLGAKTQRFRCSNLYYSCSSLEIQLLKPRDIVAQTQRYSCSNLEIQLPKPRDIDDQTQRYEAHTQRYVQRPALVREIKEPPKKVKKLEIQAQKNEIYVQKLEVQIQK